MRIRFSIRGLLLLTLVVALVVGWWLDHRQLAEANEQLIAASENLACSYAVSSPIRGRALKALQASFAEVPGVRFLGPRPLQGYPGTDCYLISAPDAVQAAIGGALDAVDELARDTIDELASAGQLAPTP